MLKEYAHWSGEDSAGTGRRAARRLRPHWPAQENRHGESRQILRGCHPPRDIVIATRTPPRITIARPIVNGRCPAWRPNAYPVRNSIAMAIPFETRKASRASADYCERDCHWECRQYHNQEHADARQANRLSEVVGVTADQAIDSTPARICSRSAEDKTDTSRGGSASAMIWCASAGLADLSQRS